MLAISHYSRNMAARLLYIYFSTLGYKGTAQNFDNHAEQ